MSRAPRRSRVERLWCVLLGVYPRDFAREPEPLTHVHLVVPAFDWAREVPELREQELAQ